MVGATHPQHKFAHLNSSGYATISGPVGLLDVREFENMAICKGVVLVVEDHPLVRMGVLEVMIEAGFEALEASSAVEAIQMLEARPDVHLVFTDAEMPGTMDGIEMVHYIRNRWPPVKLIVVSGKTEITKGSFPRVPSFSVNPTVKPPFSKRWSACSPAG
jgi:CheY-like chemotaxis protein